MANVKIQTTLVKPVLVCCVVKVRSLSDFRIIFYFQTGIKFCCSGKMTSGHKQFSRVLLVFLWTSLIGGEFYDFIVFVRT